MNRKSVIIKSNKYGLTVILDDKMPFQELLLDIADKFQESANFFRNAKMAVTFRGRVLNREEERQVIETIVDHCGIHILCVVDEDAVSQEHYRRILNAALEEQEKVDGLFYRGTLSNGEVLETETSVVILGDVHSGAKVVSKSNIVILGSCRGSLRGSDGGSQLFYCRLCDETGSDPYCRQSCTQCNHQIFGSDRIQAGTENCLYKRKSYPCGTYEPRYMGCRLWVSRKNLKITVKTQNSSQCTQDKRPKRRNRSFSLKRLWDNHKFDLKRFMEECVMSEIIVVTSGKGGVGKTTVTANLGAGLSMLGGRVVLIDTDIGLRNLDVVMGLENRIVYNLVDVIEGNCRLKQALIRDKNNPSLFLLPAAQTRDKSAVTPQQMKKLTDDLQEKFDFILLDCPAGIEQGFFNAIAGAKRAIVVTTPEVSAIRDADRIIGLLEANEIDRIDLIINRLRMGMVKRGDMMSVEDVVEILSVNLLGAIPDDDSVVIATNQGEALAASESLAGQAFSNICRRIYGEAVPLMDFEQRDGFWRHLGELLKRGRRE